MKWIAWILILGGLGVLISDFINADEDGFRLTSTGEWWAWLHLDSLLLLQPAIERHVSVWLYESMIQPLLEWSLAVELVVLGVALLALRRVFRRR